MLAPSVLRLTFFLFFWFLFIKYKIEMLFYPKCNPEDTEVNNTPHI